MVSKKKGGLTVLGLLAILGAGTFTFGDINFGTIIGQVGDNNFIENYIIENFGINVEEFRKQCEAGVYTDPVTLNYCKLV